MGDQVSEARAQAMERMAVALSFWIGGAGLALLKGAAYVATGSVLVRTSMFDSIGDVFSSAIMAVTQWQMSNSRDAHRYPMGKARFAPLGVLFFCAFMCSSMSSMAIDSVQTLIATEEEDTAAADAATAAVRRLFEDRPRLRWAYGPGRSVETLAAEYGSQFGGGDAGEDTDMTLSARLMALCVVVKLLLWLYCKAVGRVQNSEIVKALSADHRNDTITNAVVIGAMYLVTFLQQAGYGGPLLGKVDPAVSLLLSVWIVYGWITNACDQLKVLSDRRADTDDVDAEAIRQAASGALEGLPLELRSTDVYHAGEGFRVRLELCPANGSTGAQEERLAGALSKVRSAAREAAGDSEVLAVETCILPREEAFSSKILPSS